jgi:hypothetical protein
LKENPDYEEAKLHWEQDQDIGIDPEVIEAQVNTLNNDVGSSILKFEKL